MKNTKLYEKVYTHYRDLILEGKLKSGDKMPSIRSCVNEMSVSKTTAENAYFQLVADGYIYSKSMSGYYVTEKLNSKITSRDSSLYDVSAELQIHRSPQDSDTKDPFQDIDYKYDLSVIGDDSEAFCFDLWQRYMKSALRNTEKLASFGLPQGEYELREEISKHVRKTKNIYCNPEDIIIGASTQSLLMILLRILKPRMYKTASVPAEGFKRYENVFKTYDLTVDFRDKNADIIYVSPAHMTAWGELMSLGRRHEIASHSKNGHFIIEDDYQSELNFLNRPSPAIYTLTNGENVAYIGSFSRVLLPSIRISYMVLPQELTGEYRTSSYLFDQTASKTEQIALCMFLRDEKLNSHIKSIRKLYFQKREILTLICKSICRIAFRFFEEKAETKLLKGECGTELAVSIYSNTCMMSEKDIVDLLRLIMLKANIQRTTDNSFNLIFSCGIAGMETLLAIQKEMEKL